MSTPSGCRGHTAQKHTELRMSSIAAPISFLRLCLSAQMHRRSNVPKVTSSHTQPNRPGERCSSQTMMSAEKKARSYGEKEGVYLRQRVLGARCFALAFKAVARYGPASWCIQGSPPLPSSPPAQRVDNPPTHPRVGVAVKGCTWAPAMVSVQTDKETQLSTSRHGPPRSPNRLSFGAFAHFFGQPP